MKILKLLDQPHIPCIPGAEHPLLSPLMTATAFHGESGVGEWEGESAEVALEIPRAWSTWFEQREDLSRVHLIATGPLTNLAISFLAYPQLANAWASITCMGGALPGAQVDKAQEFNVYVDPHAADIVFHWAQRVQLIGINVAHKAVIPINDLEKLSRYGAVGQMLSRMLGFYSERSRGEGGDPTAFPIDDVVAVSAVVEPDLFAWEELPLAVVREGPLRGTVVLSPLDLKRPLVRVARDVDAKRFRQWVWDSMQIYSK